MLIRATRWKRLAGQTLCASVRYHSTNNNLERARSALCPTGILRVGVNRANFLLADFDDGGESSEVAPRGIAPDIAREIAARLDVALRWVPFESPGGLADSPDTWDIAFLGIDPARTGSIRFSAPYVAKVVPAASMEEALQLFVAREVDALAGGADRAQVYEMNRLWQG